MECIFGWSVLECNGSLLREEYCSKDLRLCKILTFGRDLKPACSANQTENEKKDIRHRGFGEQ